MRKEKIYEVTKELLDEIGLDNVSVRKIAERANVNVASINYYYGSKDNLLNMIFEEKLIPLKESFNILQDTSLSPRERIEGLCVSCTNVLLSEPAMLKRLISDQSISGAQEIFFGFLSEQMQQLGDVFHEVLDPVDDTTVHIMVRQLTSLVFFPVVLLNISSQKIRDKMYFPGSIMQEEGISVEKNIRFYLDHFFKTKNDA